MNGKYTIPMGNENKYVNIYYIFKLLVTTPVTLAHPVV